MLLLGLRFGDRGHVKSLHGLMVGSIARRRYHHMGSSDSGR